jgi:hypothetical protein
LNYEPVEEALPGNSDLSVQSVLNNYSYAFGAGGAHRGPIVEGIHPNRRCLRSRWKSSQIRAIAAEDA